MIPFTLLPGITESWKILSLTLYLIGMKVFQTHKLFEWIEGSNPSVNTRLSTSLYSILNPTFYLLYSILSSLIYLSYFQIFSPPLYFTLHSFPFINFLPLFQDIMFYISADREVQRILLELLNQMDGFDQTVNVKVSQMLKLDCLV